VGRYLGKPGVVRLSATDQALNDLPVLLYLCDIDGEHGYLQPLTLRFLKILGTKAKCDGQRIVVDVDVLWHRSEDLDFRKDLGRDM
jgi:hypothetical protein